MSLLPVRLDSRNLNKGTLLFLNFGVAFLYRLAVRISFCSNKNHNKNDCNDSEMKKAKVAQETLNKRKGDPTDPTAREFSRSTPGLRCGFPKTLKYLHSRK